MHPTILKTLVHQGCIGSACDLCMCNSNHAMQLDICLLAAAPAFDHCAVLMLAPTCSPKREQSRCSTTCCLAAARICASTLRQCLLFTDAVPQPCALCPQAKGCRFDTDVVVRVQ